MPTMVKEYETKLDSRRRLTLKSKEFDYYHVSEYDDGTIKLEPRILTAPFQISKRTRNMIDSSMENFKNGIVSEEIDLSEFEK